MSVAVLSLDGGRVDVLGDRGNSSLMLPLRGAWSARLEVDLDDAADAPVGSAATLELAGDETVQSFAGTVVASSVLDGRGRVTLLGGAARLSGDLAETLTPRAYVATPTPVLVGQVLVDIFADTGETPSLSNAAAALLILPAWLRCACTGAQALDALVDALSALMPLTPLGWRVLASGEVWVGLETWPSADAAGLIVEADDGDAGLLRVAFTEPTLRPGWTVGTRRLHEVVYRIGERGLRADLLYRASSRAELAAAVAAVSPPAVYSQAHGATVLAQAGDDTLTLAVDDVRIGTIAGVPLRCGIPGARLLVPAETRVRLAFEGGSPAKPFAFALDGDADASRGVARVDDSIHAGTITATCAAAPGPVSFVYTPPGGAPQAPTPTLVLSSGKITSGSTEVLLRG